MDRWTRRGTWEQRFTIETADSEGLWTAAFYGLDDEMGCL